MQVPTINIAHICLSLEVGGLEKVILTLAKDQRKQGHSVTVVCLDTIGDLGDELISHGVRVFCYNRRPGPIDLTVLNRVRKHLLKFEIELLHTHNVEAFVYGMIASMFTAIKTIHTQHGIPGSFSLLKNVLLRTIGLKNNKFICVSDSVSKYIKNQYWVPKNDIDVIINGIDTSEFIASSLEKYELRNKYNIPENSVILITVSRIEAVKDHSSLIDQFFNVVGNMPRCRLVVVGDGSLKNELERQITKKNLESSVTLTGMINDVKCYLQMADFFVMTSISEGISISLLEAMSSGLIPIVTPVGGNTQIVESGVSGYFLDKNDSNSLLNYVGQVINDKTKRDKLSDNARHTVVERFSKNAMTEKYMQCYEKLLA